jgi:hypothetical protein
MWKQAEVVCKVLIDWTECVFQLGLWIIQRCRCGLYTADSRYYS